MSWKGFQRAMNRLPHNMLYKKGEATKDIEFEQLETRFQETAAVVNQLKADVQTYYDGILAYIYHQQELGMCLAALYSKNVGIQQQSRDQSTSTTTIQGEREKQDNKPGSDSEDNDGLPNGNITTPEIYVDGMTTLLKKEEPETPALQAAKDMEAAMALCRDNILAELASSLQNNIARPITEIQAIIKQIQNTIVKRKHKLVEYDRYRHQLNKLSINYKRPSEPKGQPQQQRAKHDVYKQQRQQQKEQQQHSHDEKAIFKLQAQVETATIEYDTLNQSLKDQLPLFFHFFQEQFIKPIFERLCLFQHAFYHTLFTYCDDLKMANLEYFSESAHRKRVTGVAKELSALKMFNLDEYSSSISATNTTSGRRRSTDLGIKNRLSAQLKNSRSNRNDRHERAPPFKDDDKNSSRTTIHSTSTDIAQ